VNPAPATNFMLTPNDWLCPDCDTEMCKVCAIIVWEELNRREEYRQYIEDGGILEFRTANAGAPD